MSKAPSRIWIMVAGKELPEWVLERLMGDVAADGTFEIEASDGLTKVERGFAVFDFDGQVFACPPKLVGEKLAKIAGPDNEVVAELGVKQADQQQRQAAADRAKAERRKFIAGNQPLKLKPMIGTPPAPQFIAIDQLLIDDTYQRSIEGGSSRTLIRKIAENWDWRLCLPLLVSRRAGKLFVIDGQHRKEGAELRGDIHHLPVVVFDFDDPKAEAELFVAANRSRRAMSKLDDFHAAVVAGDKKSVAINEVVTGAGLRIARLPGWQSLKPGDVVFVKAIEKALANVGRPMVDDVLGMISRAFDGLILIGVGAVFDGICTLMQQRAKADAPIDLALMEVVLAEVGIPGWKEATARAESGPERAEAMLKALTAAYEEAEAQ